MAWTCDMKRGNNQIFVFVAARQENLYWQTIKFWGKCLCVFIEFGYRETLAAVNTYPEIVVTYFFFKN